MITDDLIAFEEEMAALFNAGQIKAPLHLAGGNESALIDIFKHVRKDDWVLCTWRSHYHCLLKGVSPEKLRERIIEGRSIALCFKDQKILSSAIVGGILPIAVGIAWAIKKRGGSERVWAFIGDMTAYCGLATESHRYAKGHDLPLHIVIENNGVSVCTDTTEAWGGKWPPAIGGSRWYSYKLTRPHVGTGQWVAF